MKTNLLHLIKEGYSIIGKMPKTGETVLRQISQTGKQTSTNYLLFDNSGLCRRVTRNVNGKRAGWIIDKPNGNSTCLTYSPQSISIVRSGKNIDRTATDIFISKDGKNIESITKQFGWNRITKDYKNGRIIESSPGEFKIHNYLSPKKWTSLNKITGV